MIFRNIKRYISNIKKNKEDSSKFNKYISYREEL